MKKITKKKNWVNIKGTVFPIYLFFFQIGGFLVILDSLELTQRKSEFFFKKYKTYTLFYYQVYLNRIKIEKTMLFYFFYRIRL